MDPERDIHSRNILNHVHGGNSEEVIQNREVHEPGKQITEVTGPILRGWQRDIFVSTFVPPLLQDFLLFIIIYC